MNQNLQKIINNLKNPSQEFTPLPFWFFNDSPDKVKIKKQLEDYVQKGINGFVLHPRIGIPKEIEYLSKAYFEVINYIVETAAQLNMKVVLYDEGMYPSGSAHGKVVKDNPQYASKGIRIADKGEILKPNEQCIVNFPDGRILAYGYTGGTIRGIHFGEDDGEIAAPLSADILNPNAVDCFIQLTHDQYYEVLSNYFGNTIIAFFTDEPCALGRNTLDYREWYQGLENDIVAEGGNLQELYLLFENAEALLIGNNTVKIYHRLIKKRLRDVFYNKLYEWCETHHIALMGHPEASDDVEEEMYFHIPGQDLIMRRVSLETGGIREFDSVQAKLTADIARHLGRRRNANECFGVCNRRGADGKEIPWYFTGKDMKWYINWLGFRGVNLFVPHAFYYSVADERSAERPPDVGPNNIWWKYYKSFSDYMKRISYLMTDSSNEAKVAVLCDNNQVPYKEIALLYENQIEFNYLPIALLPMVSDNKICIQGYEYDTVLNVIDAEIDLQMKGLNIFHTAQELIMRSGMKSTSKDLRVTRFHKDGISMLLASNEGTDILNTVLTVPSCKSFIEYDLWNNTYSVKTKKDIDCIELCLKPCQMLLLIFDEETAVYTTANVKNQETPKCIGDITERFLSGKVSKSENQVAYTYKWDSDIFDSFIIRGEEMAECYCNGNFAGVSFYNPHEFNIKEFLKENDNEVKVVFTGNAANIYEHASISYGIIE